MLAAGCASSKASWKFARRLTAVDRRVGLTSLPRFTPYGEETGINEKILHYQYPDSENRSCASPAP